MRVSKKTFYFYFFSIYRCHRTTFCRWYEVQYNDTCRVCTIFSILHQQIHSTITKKESYITITGTTKTTITTATNNNCTSFSFSNNTRTYWLFRLRFTSCFVQRRTLPSCNATSYYKTWQHGMCTMTVFIIGALALPRSTSLNWITTLSYDWYE